MTDIKILPENVANQIAAGEVIERPSSVIRELLDNSIDAGADEITIKIDRGGKSLIRLKDNGEGMNRENLLLAMERHATSKIGSVSDLFSIKSLGFRGEALPSIGSVSRITITSRPAGQLSGYRLKASGGRLESIDETGAPAGTSVEVRDLFYNTPARRKFLKADRTETGHIVDTLSRIVLPYTNVRLRVDDAEKILLHLPASDNELSRLSALLGRDVALSLIDTAQEKDGLKLRAYLAPPDLSRARGDRLFIYVNNRSIRDKIIIRSITEGYGQRLMKGRYPQAVVFLEIDPSLVDVNVHPAKQEVRFHDGSLIYKLVSSALHKALGDQCSPIPGPGYKDIRPVQKTHPSGEGIAEPSWEYRIEITEDSHPVKTEARQERMFADTPRVIGQLKDTYLLFQAEDGLLLVDQHAAHERILYESLKRDYQSSRMECQPFLIPHTLELSLKEGRIVEEKLDQLAGLGFELEFFGGSTFLLRSVPSALVHMDWESFLLDLIPVLEEESDLTSEKALDRMLTVMSCHGAIRAGKRMSREEMALLLKQLEKTDLPTNCPHGRPVLKKFTYYEIEKMFKRIV